MILLDTSGILAALFADQRHHEECAKVLREAEGPLILSPFVLAECVRVIRRRAGGEAVRMLLEDVQRGAYELVPFDETGTGELLARHDLGLATASLFVLAERYACRKILSLRPDCFTKRFQVLPV